MDEPVFSNHVQSLLDGTFDGSPAIISHLQREIRRQLKSIGQWNLPPSYLGFDGESWEGSDAMDDLTQEVYIHCIQKRLPKLGQHLATTGSCEGSVRKKLRWYLQDCQEKGSPIARRVFRNVRYASESLVESGKAETSCLNKLTGKTNILALGQSVPATAEELAGHFAGELGDREFTRLVSRECPASWRTIESAVANRFDLGLCGYRIGELTKLFADECKVPSRVAESDGATEDGEKNILDLLSESRTDVRNGRYVRESDVDDRDQLDALLRYLIEHTNATIRNPRIKNRVLRMLEKIIELIRQGEDIRKFSRRKLASTLGVSKSTLAEDMARLQTSPRLQDAPKNEME